MLPSASGPTTNAANDIDHHETGGMPDMRDVRDAHEPIPGRDPAAGEHERASADVSRDQPTFLGAPWPLGWRTAGVLVAWCLAVIAVFAAVGEIIERTAVDDSDREIARDIVERRTTTGNDIAPWAAGLSDTLVKIIATTIIVGIMFAVWRRWRDPLVVAVSLIFEATAFIVITTITSRPRPEVERLQESPVNSSYPSGHVAAATAYFAIALVVSRHLRSTWAKIVVWVVPGLIALTVAVARMYQGMHYLSDVIVGIVLGAVSVVIVDRVIPQDGSATDDRNDAA
jgi:membrane-associated phospholipid phosphatase